MQLPVIPSDLCFLIIAILLFIILGQCCCICKKWKDEREPKLQIPPAPDSKDSVPPPPDIRTQPEFAVEDD